jgi:uncharacterized membrane protein
MPCTKPYSVGLIYLTGVFELLRAAGVWVPRLIRLTGICLIVMLLCVLPANVISIPVATASGRAIVMPLVTNPSDEVNVPTQVRPK